MSFHHIKSFLYKYLIKRKNVGALLEAKKVAKSDYYLVIVGDGPLSKKLRKKVEDENIRNLNLIVNSYKFRLIQLCKTHLRDGYITESDFEQITEMYKLYHGLGGNGQAQEYYDKVLELDIKKDNDIQ